MFTLYSEKSCASDLDLNEDKQEIMKLPHMPSEPLPELGVHLSAEFFNNEKPEIDKKAEETILFLQESGKDGRKEKNVRKFPYSAQVYFSARFPKKPGAQYLGSGTFIDENVILTAGHVVYSHDFGGLCKELKCIPAADRAKAPVGVQEVRGVKIASNFRGLKQLSHDYALVFVNEPVGLKTGYFGLAVLDHQYLKNNVLVNVAGYPLDKLEEDKIERPVLYGMEGKITSAEIDSEELYHNIDTVGGQSGSGIWYHKEKGFNPGYYLVGVHAYGGVEGGIQNNSGPRLTKKKAEKILRWIEDDKNDKLVFDSPDDGIEEHEEFEDPEPSTAPDEEKLPPELLKKAKEGDGEAMYDVALKYNKGEGVDKNEKRALEWYARSFKYYSAKAKEPGNAEALHRLGVIYSKHEVHIEAKKKYKEAAALNYPKSSYNLGCMFENGAGVKKDFVQAVKWYEQAADQGVASAQYRLYSIYKTGRPGGIAKDKLKANDWLKKSADNGNIQAKKILEKKNS